MALAKPEVFSLWLLGGDTTSTKALNPLQTFPGACLECCLANVCPKGWQFCACLHRVTDARCKGRYSLSPRMDRPCSIA